MTKEKAIKMMKAKLECMTRESRGIDEVCNAKRCNNCYLCYEQGNIGEQKEWLKLAIETLENQKTGHWIDGVCDRCSYMADERVFKGIYKYCPCCGAKMEGENNGTYN